MPIQILPQTGFGERLGTSLGTGLSQALSGLAALKAQELQQRQQSQRALPGLQALGFSPEQASSLSFLDPSIQKEVVKQQMLAPQQEAFAQALGQLLGHPVQQGVSREKEGDIPDVGVEPHEAFPKPIAPRLTQDQAFKLAQLQLEKGKISSKERSEAFKLTKEERKEIIQKSQSARQNLQDLSRMEELEKEGKLDTPGYVEFLKRSGLDIPALMNPGSEEFQKIAQTFMRDAKSYLGARISNFELDQFLKTIPSLSQSPEGRKRVIANLKRFNRVSLEYNNALKEVLKENEGVPPLDLLEKIDDKIEKKLDSLSKKFKEDLDKPVPQGQNKLITALQSVAGSAIGVPGKLVGGVGHLLGSGLAAL